MPAGGVLYNVLVLEKIVRALDQRSEPQIDFRLASGGDFMVLSFHHQPSFNHQKHHLVADILLGIGRGHGEISLFEARLVSQVRPFITPAVPDPFFRIDEIVSLMGFLVETDIVKDEKLGLRAEMGDIRDTG